MLVKRVMPNTDVAANQALNPAGHCAYPWQQMIIDLTGEVVPCCFWSGYGNSGKPLGNTNVQTVDEIWNGEAYREFGLRNASGDLQGYPCHECMSYRWSNGQYPRFTWSASFVPDSGYCYYTLIPEAFRTVYERCEESPRLYEDGK